MSSRGATPGLYHRTGTQLSPYQQLSLSVRAKRTQSFNREYVGENFGKKSLHIFVFSRFSYITNYRKFFDLFVMLFVFV